MAHLAVELCRYDNAVFGTNGATMMRTPTVLAIAALSAASAAAAADNPSLTIYRADGDALFQNGTGVVADGYAVVHESRAVKADANHTVVIGGLPTLLDPEAVSVDLGGATIVAQRVLSSGDGGALAARRGETVQIDVGGRSLSGTLLGIDNGAPILRGADGQVVYAHAFDIMLFPKGGGAPGSTLQVVTSGNVGANATLTYPTTGLGWRAAYSVLLRDGNGCHMTLDAFASIANRSGRDYPASTLKLIAGSPNLTHNAPRPMFKAMRAAPAAAAAPMPEQSSLGDYRSYALASALDLPDASVTQVPLYAPGDLDCQRAWIFETGGSWFPQQPMTGRDDIQASGNGPVVSELHFSSTENLPSGHVRVSTRDRDGRVELLGESSLADTPKDRPVTIALGTAFDLAADRERTSFDYDRPSHSLTEAFRVTLTNTGETPRTITVRDHPNRWRAWTLASSSVKPTKQSADGLAFDIAVQANVKATLEYVVKYQWAAADEVAK
jgi:hypothetical protein